MRIRLSNIEMQPLDRIRHLDAGRGGPAVERDLPVLRGTVNWLPDGLDALVVASDLQGREPRQLGADGPLRLLGCQVAETLERWCREGRLPPAARVGVVLCGDLYAHPELAKRGTHGDVRDVWRSFAARFRWVVGVAGNHDVFGEHAHRSERRPLEGVARAHFLDGAVVDLDGLRIGGVSGVIGKPTRLFRMTEPDYLAAVERVLEAGVDILALHDGPDFPPLGLLGIPKVREVLERRPPVLVARGHCYWKEPLVTLEGGSQVLNADSRVVVLTAGIPSHREPEPQAEQACHPPEAEQWMDPQDVRSGQRKVDPQDQAHCGGGPTTAPFLPIFGDCTVGRGHRRAGVHACSTASPKIQVASTIDREEHHEPLP